ncbi:hypothetical protein ACEWY4_001625 [Coilia grayii]|uniref:Sec16 Sec23-binding domain-containing protein n=1 Tax=Coilia grayii TaxID=363190 RepID=A0ABD1KTG7_9TELE
MAATKSAMDLPLRVNERGGKRVTFCECPAYFNCALETSPKATSVGQGDVPVRRQESRRLDEEDLPNGCDPVLAEVYHLAMLERERYLDTATKAESKVVGLGWGLLALLCKKNGMVSGEDVADLLLQKSSVVHEAEACSATTSLVRLLVAGKTKEAIELAVDQGSWDHAFGLNSLDRCSSPDWVTSSFIGNLKDNDAMKTYYQVRLGEVPAAASSACGDDSWGKWLLHLAIILSNSSSFSIQKQTIEKMAETFSSGGRVLAARFCQMVLQFDSVRNSTKSVRVLVGEWMGLLAEMDKHLRSKVTEDAGLPASEQPVGPVKMKTPLSRDEFKQLISPLLPPMILEGAEDTKDSSAPVPEDACEPQSDPDSHCVPTVKQPKKVCTHEKMGKLELDLVLFMSTCVCPLTKSVTLVTEVMDCPCLSFFAEKETSWS